MSFRDSDRFEYIRQPHVIVVMIIIGLILAAAGYTAFDRLQERNRRATAGTETACFELIGDADLCRFAAMSEESGQQSYRSVVTSVDASGTTITNFAIESTDRMQSITSMNGQAAEAFVLIDADAYARDPADNVWAHYRDPDFVPAAAEDTVTPYDFTSETSQDVIEFRDYYNRVGEESCDGRTCLKYEVRTPEEPGTTTYLWFDTEQYLLRRYQTITEEITTNTQLNYEPVTITAPSPIKEVDEAAFNALIE